MRDNFAGILHVHDKFHKWLFVTFLAKVNYAATYICGSESWSSYVPH